MTTPGAGLPVRVHGLVVAGDGRGRLLGFPTANVDVADPATLPPDGIYASLVRLHREQQWRPASTSIGNNPTFADVAERRVEVHIHDTTALHLYGQRIEVELCHLIRPMWAYASEQELITQMRSDIALARELLRRER